MSFKDVTSLRKEGRLDEAIEMAWDDFSSDPNNYSASALFWTLKLLCERSLREHDCNSALTYFQDMQTTYEHMDDYEGIAERSLSSLETKVFQEYNKITSLLSDSKAGNSDDAIEYVLRLDFEEYPERVQENIAWIIYYHIKLKMTGIDMPAFDTLTCTYFKLQIPKPSIVHSQMLNLAIKFAGLNNSYDLVGFIKRWGVCNFSEEDCKSDPSFAGGLSLKERAIRRCFINQSTSLSDVIEIFSDDDSVNGNDIAELLSRSYYSILYKDSAESKNKNQYYKDAEAYINRIEGVDVSNVFHSKILDSVIWELDNNKKSWFKTFFEKWGLESGFLDEDWKSISKDGISRVSLAERALTKYAESIDNEAINTETYKELLKYALGKLEGNENIARRLAKLYFNEGQKEEAVQLIKNLIQNQAAKYYFWFDLAEYVEDNMELCAACCAQALLMNPDEKYVGKIHLVLGALLHEMGKDNEAFFEIERYRLTNEENGWPVKGSYHTLKAQLSTQSTTITSNKELYKSLAVLADEFLFSDLPSTSMVLCDSRFEENSNGKNRLMFYLYDSNHQCFRINPSVYGLNRKAKIKSCFAVKYVEKEGRIRIISVKHIQNTPVLKYQNAVVDNVNTTKNVVHVVGKDFQVVIPSNEIPFNVNVCDCLQIAIRKRLKEGRTILNCIDIIKSKDPNDLLEEQTGVLRILENENGKFGFVNDIYINRRLLYDFNDGESVSVKGVMENKKFKALKLERHNG